MSWKYSPHLPKIIIYTLYIIDTCFISSYFTGILKCQFTKLNYFSSDYVLSIHQTNPPPQRLQKHNFTTQRQQEAGDQDLFQCTPKEKPKSQK